MSLLAIGLSHRTAPMPVLERVALSPELVEKLLGDAAGTEHVREAIAVATCNRLEVYADVTKFHGALADLSELISHYTGVSADELTAHLYVHYDQRAAAHMFTVACGLDSMVVGEPQVLGQLRAALAVGQRIGTAGRVLNDLAQTALRVGKRAHSETGLDQAGQSLVTAALDLALPHLGGRVGRACVVGAGSMSALAATTLARLYPGLDLTVVNRTVDRAERLAAGLGATAAGLESLPQILSGADLVVSCTGAADTVLTAAHLTAAALPPGGRRAVIDLALPRDVEPAVAALPGHLLVDLAAIAESQQAGDRGEGIGVAAVRTMIAEELDAYAAAQRAAAVAPTVTALRGKAAGVVDTELSRFAGRVPDLDERTRAEVANLVRRVVDKLLHEPTVRVKQLAVEPGGASYAAALSALFNLDPAAAAAVSRAEVEELT
ncbi:MAG TPA: glutamyl-tRNA reductase [Actinocrinis sp.]|nr:glutamyl-tRNA reductase [Actinocrinis sp.]